MERTWKMGLVFLALAAFGVAMAAVPARAADDAPDHDKSTLEQLGFELKQSGDKLSIQKVRSGSPADRAGLKQGDEVVTLNNQQVSSADHLTRRINEHGPDLRLSFTVRRDGQEQQITLVAAGKRDRSPEGSAHDDRERARDRERDDRLSDRGRDRQDRERDRDRLSRSSSEEEEDESDSRRGDRLRNRDAEREDREHEAERRDRDRQHGDRERDRGDARERTDDEREARWREDQDRARRYSRDDAREDRDRADRARHGADRDRDDEETVFSGQERASLGVTLSEGGGSGVRVASVLPDGPAAEAGIRRGDRIVAMDGREVTSYRDVVRHVGQHDTGEECEIEIQRGNRIYALEVRLEPWGEVFDDAVGPPDETGRYDRQLERRYRYEDERELRDDTRDRDYSRDREFRRDRDFRTNREDSRERENRPHDGYGGDFDVSRGEIGRD